MRYITRKDSETGLKLQAMLKNAKVAFKAQKDFASKYGFKAWRGAYFCVHGGISSLLNTTEIPDPKIWGKGVEKGEFFPKKNCKEGLKIYQEIKGLPVVTYEEVNKIVGYENDWNHIGYDISKDYFGILVEEKWKIKMPLDCEEVTVTKFNEIFDA